MKMHKQINHWLGVAVITGLTLAGCSSSEQMYKDEAAQLKQQLDQKGQEIAKLESSKKEMESAAANAQAELTKKTNELSEARSRLNASTPTTQVTAGPEMFPNAKPGECFAKVYVPPVYKTETAQELKRDASEKVEIIPAKYEMAQERILVREASKKIVVDPAIYETVEEKVEVKPATTKTVVVPAQYETVTEKVLDTPAHTTWKKGKGVVEKVDESTGEIMCLVEVPATYKTVSKRVLKSPATSKEVEVPAVFTTVKKKVLKTPSTTREVEVPAEYKVVKVKKEVTPADVKRIPVSAEYQTVTKKELVSEGRMEWRQIVCETNATKEIITEVQNALKTAGHNPGPINGKLGVKTLQAIRLYQKDKGLPTGGLTVQTLESLGVKAQ